MDSLHQPSLAASEHSRAWDWAAKRGFSTALRAAAIGQQLQTSVNCAESSPRSLEGCAPHRASRSDWGAGTRRCGPRPATVNNSATFIPGATAIMTQAAKWPPVGRRLRGPVRGLRKRRRTRGSSPWTAGWRVMHAHPSGLLGRRRRVSGSWQHRESAGVNRDTEISENAYRTRPAPVGWRAHVSAVPCRHGSESADRRCRRLVPCRPHGPGAVPRPACGARRTSAIS